MTATELRASFALAGIFGLRMLGMFIILPVFALYAEHLPGGSDHTLIGLALGAYGLTQALLQIPFGWLSDRWGRKRTIYLGLLIFAAGSFVAAVAQSIYMVILGRVIQGAGAISAAVMALLADLTREEQSHQGDGDHRAHHRRHLRAVDDLRPGARAARSVCRAFSRSPACWRCWRWQWCGGWFPTRRAQWRKRAIAA